MDVLGIARAVAGIVLLGILPGWMWSRVLLPTIAPLERALASIALSISMMTLALFLGSTVAGIAVTPAHAVWWSLGLTAAAWAAKRRRRSPEPTRDARPR